MTLFLSMEEARKRAMFREMESNPNVLLIGGDPSRKTSPEYKERFSERMLDPPLSEFAYSSVAIGAAMGGLRPFVSVHTSSFIFYGWPALVLEAANVRYASSSSVTAPVVFSLIAGTRRGGGPQHQHTPHAMLQNIPGLRILAPATPGELDSAIHEALTGNDPTVIVEHTFLEAEGEVSDTPAPLAFVNELVKGSGVAIVAYSYMASLGMDAAISLGKEGISVGVFSVPVIAPTPAEDIVHSVGHYRSVLFLDESIAPGSPASFWMANFVQRIPDTNVALLCSKPVPVPAAVHLCNTVVPSVSDIVDAVRILHSTVDATSSRSEENVRV